MTVIDSGGPADETALLDMLPQLADFDLPTGRAPRDLWYGDAELLRRHLAGATAHTRLLVARASDGAPVGLALVSLGEEALSHAPNAHLEALVVSAAARGQGLGRRLLAAFEALAAEAGARTVTLNAFKNNERARGLYESAGYDGEIIRYIKSVPAPE